jgi:hypothetical protein
VKLPTFIARFFPHKSPSKPTVIYLDLSRPTGTLKSAVTPPAQPKNQEKPVNILITIEVDVEKFLKGTGSDLEKFAAAFDKLFKKVPNALQTVENFVNEAAPAITAAVAIADPVVEPEVAMALALVETGLASIQAAATAANSGQSLLQNIESFSATVPQLLTGLAIKDPALQATVTRVVTLVDGECRVLIPVVQSWVAQIKAATRAPAVPVVA